MNRSWLGPMVAGGIILGVVTILFLNFQPDQPTGSVANSTEAVVDPEPSKSGPVREYPIGDPTQRNHLQVAAVWLPGVAMEGMGSQTSGSIDLIHLEADIRSLGDNPNGFAKNEFVPYLKVTYSIVPQAGGEPIDKGDFYPMIAADGLHYGANIVMPKPGTYRLVYQIEPPSAGGLGRHVGVGGVAPWWQPFTAEFEWNVEPPPPATSLAGSR